VPYLSAATTIVETAHKGLEGIIALLVEPAVSEVGVLGFRHVGKGIVVPVHGHEPAAVMGEHTRIEVVLELPTAHNIGLCHRLGIDHEVKTQRILGIGFEQLHIDLSGGGLIAVNDGRGAFADLNTAHPRTGYILEAEILRETAHGRRVLLDELDIRAAQAEQTNLLGPCRRVRIRHIDRSVRLKRLGEVTARRPTEFFGVDLLRIESLHTALDLAFLALHNGDFLDLEITRLLCKNRRQ